MSEQTMIQNPLGTEKVGKLMFRFAVPSVIALVVNSLYNMVDQIFIGQGVGYLGNAATNVILPLTLFLMAVGLMFGDGAAAFMSLNLGKKDPDTAARGVGNMITLTVAIGIILLILFEIFLEPVCNFFGATEGSLPYALAYGRIIVVGFPLMAVASSFSSVIRADGRPKLSMGGLIVGCITNIILDPVFIFVFHWGVEGAALATILGQLLNAVYSVVCVLHFKTIRLKKEYFIPKWQISKKIIALGLSSFITQIAAVLLVAVMNNLLVKYGALSKYGADIPLAALGITMKASQLITSITLGISSGIQPIFGYNYGSTQYGRVKETFKKALLCNTAIMIVATFLFQVFPEAIISIFGQESELYVEFAVKCFRIYLMALIFMPISGLIGILFQAIGKPVPAALLSLSRQVIIALPVMVILAYMIGIDGILWAGPVADILSGIISFAILGACWNKIFSQAETEKKRR